MASCFKAQVDSCFKVQVATLMRAFQITSDALHFQLLE